jgi:VWFA-related protein
VSVPRNAVLESVAVFVGDRALGTLEGPPFGAELPIGAAGAGTVVRVEITLADGRRVDDAAVVGDALSEELEVNLVQLQTVVTSRDGRPLSGLVKDDFEIRQGGEVQQIDRFYLADDVALSIALVVDSSGSMAPIWQRAVAASREFLSGVLLARDRALLVDFNDRLRLAHPLTHDVGALTASLAEVEPDGGTALYDSMLFSLLQLTSVPGRRAVVVMTDGADFGSQSKPASVVELGRKLGIPIYIVELPSGGGGQTAALARGGVGATGVVADLRLIAEPTGGRVFRVAARGGLGRALGQINQELRNQYVLTYYTEKLPDGSRKSLDVRIRGRKGIRVRTTLPLDQVN